MIVGKGCLPYSIVNRYRSNGRSGQLRNQCIPVKLQRVGGVLCIVFGDPLYDVRLLSSFLHGKTLPDIVCLYRGVCQHNAHKQFGHERESL